MRCVELILKIFGLALIVFAMPAKAQAQNLSPWPYTESCSTAGYDSSCFEIDQTANNLASYGIRGSATSGTGIWGSATNGTGVAGSTSSNLSPGSASGVLGNSTGTSPGVAGFSSGGFGVYGTSTTGTAIEGDGYGSAIGVRGTSPNGTGVSGYSSGGGVGVYGASMNSVGVTGFSSAYLGVYGVSYSSHGVYGSSSSANGVWGTSTTANGVYAIIPSTGYAAIYGDSSGSGTTWAGYFNGRVSATAYVTRSDARLKTDVQSLQSGLPELIRLRPVTYKLKADGPNGTTQIGFIAQEIQHIYPNIVQTDKRTGMLSVNYTELLPVVVKALQEQQRVIKQQEERIARLERDRPTMSASVGMGFGGTAMLVLAPMGLAVVILRRKDKQPA